MNPISYARYLSTYSSTSALARELGVSRQYLSRIEQGIYDKPNQELLEWAATTINKASGKDFEASDVEQLYREWQWQKRESAKLNKALRPVTVTEYDLVKQRAINGTDAIVYYYRIFTQWRSDYWLTSHAFCVDMCLHPSPVAEYEEGKTHTMPNTLKKVLIELELIGEGFKTHER
jgi:transcriptional regulator with XRE-family HTH domain